MIEQIATVYLIELIFILVFGMANEISFANPDYIFVVGVAVGWPIFLVYAIGQSIFT